jgi:hypothetical protein
MSIVEDQDPETTGTQFHKRSRVNIRNHFPKKTQKAQGLNRVRKKVE